MQTWRKESSNLALVSSTDLLCLTETNTIVNDSNHGTVCNAAMNGTRNGGVAIVYNDGTKFQLISTYLELNFHLLRVVAGGFPILGDYLGPRILIIDMSCVL